MIPWSKPTSHRSGSSPNLFPRVLDWEVETACIRDYCIQSFVVLRPSIATSRLHAEKLSSRWLLAAFHLLPSGYRLTETVVLTTGAISCGITCRGLILCGVAAPLG